jgi:hypothetical protein
MRGGQLARLPLSPLGMTRPVGPSGACTYPAGGFPVAFAPLAHKGSKTHRWLVALHGWAMTPFTCL